MKNILSALLIDIASIALEQLKSKGGKGTKGYYEFQRDAVIDSGEVEKLLSRRPRLVSESA